MARGQSAIEFIIVVAALLFFFSVFVFFLQGSLSDKTKAQRDTALTDIGLSVQEELVLAQKSSDGYERTFILPPTVLSAPYNVTLQSGSIYLRTLDQKHALSLSVVNATGYLRVGSNTVRKVNGTIYVNV